MIERDFLLRQVHQLAQVLAVVIGRRGEGDAGRRLMHEVPRPCVAVAGGVEHLGRRDRLSVAIQVGFALVRPGSRHACSAGHVLQRPIRIVERVKVCG